LKRIILAGSILRTSHLLRPKDQVRQEASRQRLLNLHGRANGHSGFRRGKRKDEWISSIGEQNFFKN
jgi:hypothetical protein